MREDFKCKRGGLDQLKPAYLFDQDTDCVEKSTSPCDESDSEKTNTSTSLDTTDFSE